MTNEMISAEADNDGQGLTLQAPARFGAKVLEGYTSEGWASLGKRDLELLFFVLLEQDGAITRTDSNYQVARRLRLTESKVVALRKEGYAKWRPLIGEGPKEVLIRLFKIVLEEGQIEQSDTYASERRKSEGFIPLLVEHPDDRAEVEHAIKQKNGIPVYERNHEVILIHYRILLDIAMDLGLLETDPVKIQHELRELLGNKPTLHEFLGTSIGKLTWNDARAAMNEAGKIVVESSLRNLLPRFLKLAIGSGA